MSENSRVFQAAKARVFKNILGPAGFIKGRNIFLRQVDGQIQGVQFQASTWGGVYFVNVAFHYDFIPGMIALALGKKADIPQFGLLDLMMYNRLENLMPAPYPREWGYGVKVGDTEANLEMNAVNAIARISEFGEKWRDPGIFLEAFPPSLLEEDESEANRRIEMPDEIRRKLPPLEVDRILGPGWYLEKFTHLYCLMSIAIQLRQYSLATRYLELENRLSGALRKWVPFGKLRKKLKSLEKLQ